VRAQLLQHYRCRLAGQRRPEAEVSPEAESQVPVIGAAHIKDVGPVKAGRVAVGAAQVQQYGVTGADLVASDYRRDRSSHTLCTRRSTSPRL